MSEHLPSSRLNLAPNLRDIEDALHDEPRAVNTLFRKLPQGLWQRHFSALEQIEADNTGAGAEIIASKKSEYLANLLEARRAGMEEYKSNDPAFREMPEQELGAHLQALLESPDEFLGSGQTARVKRLHLAEGQVMAVKYLLTPSAKTLSAEGEHDMLYEVETITRIEDEERKLNAGERIRVPHPYFFYKGDRLQCYGMQEVLGMNIAELLDANTPATVALSERRDAIWKSLRERYADPARLDALYAEVRSFVKAMHEVCLHGDIKQANLMVDEEGVIYLIDFGQSIDMNLMTDKSREQFENLQELEYQQIVITIRTLLHQALAAS